MLPADFTPEYLRQLELLKLRARRAFLGSRQGAHRSLKRGHGLEFSDFRKYELGDDPRQIDWNLYARSDRLYVKRFEEEQDLTVLLLLDASPSMFTPATDQKWDFARSIALSLAYVALLQQDAVTIALPGGPTGTTLRGGSALHTLASRSAQIKPIMVADLQREVQRILSRIRFPGMIIFISDFMMPPSSLERLFASMMARNFEITAIQVLGPTDLNPLPGEQDVLAIDSESGQEVHLSLGQEERSEYHHLLDQHNQQLEHYCLHHRISFTQTVSTKPLATFVVENLANTGLLR